ncbi:hypothetical protein [Alteribacillus bidgolensis]|uniref:Uncharacterized protein n=1 Tax=Alteribacillus bidgolensis TaxID=930129 RepID=A0A1G8R7H7_9BACI|nr:hypothetical protein [Alteribacillus bidgolensis]SDJ12350.1 hypothetical protein SAMN05216352_1253 [Alteribacillus bidgolensis]
MKGMDWVIAVSLMAIGLSCLTMSASWLFNPDTLKEYLDTFLVICLFAGIPAFLGGLLYWIFKRK